MMTRTEIDEALAHLIKLGSHPPSPPGDSWMVAILARVVADQEQRLRALEADPCDGCGAEFGTMHADGCPTVAPYLARGGAP